MRPPGQSRLRRLPREIPVLFLLLSPWATHAATDDDLFTPEHVARLKVVSAAKISPDGQNVAYVLSVPRKLFNKKDGPAWTELHVVDLDGHSRPFVSGEVNVRGIAWSPGGTEISFLAKRSGDEHTSLYAIPLAGGESRRLLSHATDIKSYSWSPNGTSVAFTATEEVPKEEKKLRDQGFTQEVFEEQWHPVRVWVADVDPEGDADEDKPRALDLDGSASTVHWSPAGDLLAVDLAPTPATDDTFMNRSLHVVSSKDGKTKGRYDPPGEMGSYSWSPDGQRLAVISSADRNDPMEGRLVSIESDGSQPHEVLKDFQGHVTAVAWHDDRTIVFAAGVGLAAMVGRVSHDGAGLEEWIPAAAGYALRGLSLSKQDGNAAVIRHSAEHPSEVYLYSTGMPPKRLTHSNPWLEEMRFAKQETLRYKARDGLELEGVLIRPLDERPGQRYPLILAVHGGPESHVSNGWVTSYAYPGQVAAARGFAIFYPNYRGSTGRGVAFSKLGQGDPAGSEFDDLVDAADYLVAAGLADRDRVGITGGSYGGYASAWGATYYTQRFAAAVMFVGISDTISKAGTTDIPEEIYFVHHKWRLWDDWHHFLERSPIYYVEQARTPLLILHGKNDPRVPPSQSTELYRLLKTLRNAPVRLVRYPGEGHGNRRAASRYDYQLRMLRWMEHYLQGPGGDPPPAEIDYGQEEEPEPKASGE